MLHRWPPPPSSCTWPTTQPCALTYSYNHWHLPSLDIISQFGQPKPVQGGTVSFPCTVEKGWLCVLCCRLPLRRFELEYWLSWPGNICRMPSRCPQACTCCMRRAPVGCSAATGIGASEKPNRCVCSLAWKQHLPPDLQSAAPCHRHSQTGKSPKHLPGYQANTSPIVSQAQSSTPKSVNTSQPLSLAALAGFALEPGHLASGAAAVVVFTVTALQPPLCHIHTCDVCVQAQRAP